MTAISEQQVVSFLSQNTDFLLNQPQLLSQLDLSQQQSGVSSLALRQQQVFRDTTSQLRKNLNDLMQTAQANQKIYQAFSSYYPVLLQQQDFTSLSQSLCDHLCGVLPIKSCILRLYDEQLASLIAHRLTQEPQYLGRLDQQEQALLFNDDSQSHALYLMGTAENPLALLGFSSDEASHFSPNQDSLFINDFISTLTIKLADLT